MYPQYVPMCLCLLNFIYIYIYIYTLEGQRIQSLLSETEMHLPVARYRPSPPGDTVFIKPNLSEIHIKNERKRWVDCLTRLIPLNCKILKYFHVYYFSKKMGINVLAEKEQSVFEFISYY